MAKSPANPQPTPSDPVSVEADTPEVLPKRRRSKLILFGGPVLLLLALGGLWFSGVVPGFGAGHKPIIKSGPVFIKIPEIVANLNVPSGQDSYVKLEATIELSDSASVTQVERDMPRVIDVFQTYLRAMHPSELRGASGTYRLREALIDRIRLAVAPNTIRNVLFEELIVQ